MKPKHAGLVTQRAEALKKQSRHMGLVA